MNTKETTINIKKQLLDKVKIYNSIKIYKSINSYINPRKLLYNCNYFSNG